jgi:hypothetical protein
MRKGIINIAEINTTRPCVFCGENRTSKVLELLPYHGRGLANSICENCLEELREVLEEDKES